MDQLLEIAGTVAVVQLLFAAWREWRSARRIVAVGGLDAEVYAEHGCVPLQFAGSRFGIVRAAVAVTEFFMVRPKTRKQVFAARKVVGVRGRSEIDHREIRPRDHLRIMLDEGEHPTVFDRSMRRGVVSFYRTVAIRDLECPGTSEHAHCVTVRTQGSVVPVVGDVDPQWLEYAVTAAAPRSNRRRGQSPLADLPEDAIELVIIPPDTYQQARDAAAEQRGDPLRSWLMHHNPSPKAAAVHIFSKYAVLPAVLAYFAISYGGLLRASVVLFALALARITIPCVWLGVLDAPLQRLRQRARGRRQLAGSTISRSVARRRRTISLRYDRRPPPRVWTGSTAHCMSAGRRVNATDARSLAAHLWKQVAWPFT